MTDRQISTEIAIELAKAQKAARFERYRRWRAENQAHDSERCADPNERRALGALGQGAASCLGGLGVLFLLAVLTVGGCVAWLQLDPVFQDNTSATQRKVQQDQWRATMRQLERENR